MQFQPKPYHILSEDEFPIQIPTIEAELSGYANTGTFASFDGNEIAYQYFLCESAKANVVIVHGFTEFYKTLCNLYHDHKALHSADEGGDFVEIINNAPDCLLTFVREKGDDRVVVIANLSPYKIFGDFHTGIYAGEYIDAMKGQPTMLYEHMWGDILPWSYKILVKK
mgnify:CR=1 FL=1